MTSTQGKGKAKRAEIDLNDAYILLDTFLEAFRPDIWKTEKLKSPQAQGRMTGTVNSMCEYLGHDTPAPRIYKIEALKYIFRV